MANLQETDSWVDGIYQLETTDPVEGGPDGIDNLQAKQLGSRTKFLKQQIEQLGTEQDTHANALDPHPQYLLPAEAVANFADVNHTHPLPTPADIGAVKKNGDTMTGALNEARGADIASTATINLTTATGNLVDVTGTTAITAITLADGAERTVRFTGALTLTNSANLVLPSGANIATAAGDFAVFRGYAAGVVRCVAYTKANGQALVSGSFTGGTLSSALNEAHGADIASAATINLTTATGNLVDVTGTTAITAITLADGAERTVRFTGALTLTNSANLVLPTGANIATAAGDFAVFRGYAAGVVRCVAYTKANGQALNESRGADIASAATINLTTATGNLVDVTGTAAITAITLADGAERTVRFTGALTLTNGANLVLPSGANIATAAGDFAVFRGYAAGVVRCVAYTKANGQALVSGSFTGGTLSSALNEAHGADIASAATINLTTATGNLVDVTGTTAITAITLADGAERTVRFTGVLTLTNSANLVLPTGANIATAAGDFAVFRGYAAGVVRCVTYSRANGQALVSGSFTGGTLSSALNEAHGADIASAATINLTTATGNLVDVTGTTAITAITLADGAERTVRFTGTLTLTNGANLVLPSGANIATAAGDFAVFRGYAAGVVRCVAYTKANGRSTIEQKLADWLNKAIYTATNTFTVPAGVSKIRAYAIGKGGDATAGTSASVFGTAGSGGGCAYGEIAVTPGSTVSVNIAAGVATVVYNSTTMLTANPGSTGGSGGTASKDVSVTNGGAYSGGNVPTMNAGHGGSSAGSPLGAGTFGGGPASTTGTGAGCGGAGIGGQGGSSNSNSTDCSCGGGGGAGGITGSSGLGGAISNPGSGGGSGGSGPNTSIGASAGGPGRTLGTFFTDPILAHMTGPGASSKPFILSSVNYEDADNAPHGGGGAGTGSYGTNGGHGGDGGGGGGAGGSKTSGQTIRAGNGGLFGGGGSIGSSVTGSTVIGGNGGYGGGGGAAGWANGGTATGGTGGSAAVFIFY